MATAEPSAGTLRLDRWLFFARLVKSRTLAARMIEDGQVRVNGEKARQGKRAVGPGDVLTLAQPQSHASPVRIVRLIACGTRRGPASEAQALYEDLTPPPLPREDAGLSASRFAPSPGRRPTKHERERLQTFKRGGFEAD